MRKFLLIFTALLCSLLPSWAAEASYKIAFNTSKTDDLNETSLMDAVTEGKDYISSFKDLAKVYGGGPGKGIKLASSNSSKGAGKFTLNLSAAGQKNITRIVVNAEPYNNKGGSLEISGSETGSTDISADKDYEFKMDPRFKWTNLIFTVPGNKRIYIKSITVYYESDGPITEKSAKPEISGAASFTDNTEITITAASGASIYYTTDNTDPTTSSTQYSAPFTISETTTVKAIAVETGKDPSAVATATFTKKMEGDYVLVTSLDDLDEASSYIIGVQAKNAAMSNEEVSGKLKQTSVTIAGDVLTPTDNVMTFHLVKNTSGNWAFKADNYAGGKSYYIQNSTSTDCKMGSLAYYFPVTLDNNNNIIIKSSEGRWIHGYNTETTADFRNYSNNKESNSSEVQLYRLGSKVLQKPVITLSEDKVYVGEKVTVTIDKKNAEKVYYTTDGTTPSATNGNEYAAPFEVTAEAEGTITVQAIGIAEGMEPTAVVSATITVSKKEPIPDGSWVVVEKASELEVGARYVIAYNGYAVSNAAIASNKLQSTPATVTGGKLGFTDDMMVFTLGNGSAEGKYTLKSNNYNNSTADSYLSFATSGTGVNMTAEPSDLLINYKTAGSSDVAIQKESGDRMIKGSNATPVVFGYYAQTSGYHNVQLYKEVDTRVACAAPTVTITPSEVIEGENATVSISGIESGATVRYTTDGTLPTATRGTVYAGEFTLSALAANTTVKAIAYADGKKNSEVAEATVNVVLKPRMPEVTWKIGETTYTAANDGTYEVPAGTVLTIKAVNGDQIKVTNLETNKSATRPSPNTLTVNSDIKVSFASVNSEKNLESEALSAIFTRKKVVPSTPVVTWTLDGVNHTAENDSTYNVYAGTQVTVTSENADKIVVTNSVSSDGEYNAPYTFTVTADEMFTFAGKNADGTSSEITVMYTVVERPAENVYTLITDASQLKAGNKYVIAVKEQNMALSNQGNWNKGNNQYRKAVDGTQANAKFRIDENNVLHDQTFGTSSKEGIMVFTLGGSAGKWTLKADNYILSTEEPRPGELETGKWVKLYVTDKSQPFFAMTIEPSENQPFFAMTTEPSENTISIAADGSATITNSNSTGYVMKYMGTRFGMSKVGNDFPLVQLYGCVPQTKPEMPVVTYTKTIDGENVATEDCGEYTAINGSKITVTSKNATQIDINGTKYEAVNGTYSFTTDVDKLYIIKGVNEANEESAEYTLQIYVDYEAATIPEMHTLSQKQKDRTDKSLWAPVKFTGDVFIRGHYMKNDEGELSETLWVEDANANASAIYESGGEFQQPGHSIENGMMLKNFKVRSESYLNALEHNIMVLISWPEEVETDVQTYDFQNFLQQMEMAEEASANNVFKLQKFNGDITFAADGTATMTLKNGKTITVSNQLSFKGNGNKQSWSRTEGNGFNWLPGNEWLNGQTKQNTHLVGYVMPEGDGANLSYAVYPAQITDDPGNITGVDGVENDNDGVSVVDGMIKAPAGSCIFSISGANVKANQTLTGGVYVVVTPNGKVVKVLVK
mgnify:CR=1 FL=1